MANFFRSVLLRLQSKTVTAGTSTSTVSVDSGYDGISSVTVNPTPSETKTQTAGTSNIDVTPSSGKFLSKVTVSPTPTQTKSATPSTTAQTITPDSGKYLSSVSVGAISTETKTQAAGTSNIDVTPTSGKYLTKVTITPQQHSTTYTPATNKSNNDMGATHNYRYVNTSGMITPSGNKEITSNGTDIDVSSYSTASVSVTPSLQSKTDSPNVSTNKTVIPDTGYDGLSQVTITPLSHTGYYPSSSTNITSNGTSDLGANHSYRYVNVSVPNPTLSGNAGAGDVKSGQTFYNSSYTKQTGTFAADTTNNSATATTTASTKSPASGKYFASFTVNPQQHSGTYPSTTTNITSNGTKDLGTTHNYRYVNVSVPNPTLSGDAAVGNVLSGKYFYNNSYTKQQGTMTDNGAVSKTLTAGDTSYTVPVGYHNGSGSVSVTKGVAKIGTTDKTWINNGTVNLTAGQSLSVGAGVYYAGTITAPSNPTLSGDAGTGDVLSGKYFYSNSYTKQQGTISSKAAATYNTSTSDQTISSGQYLSGNQTIKAVTTSGISAANIKDGTTIKVGDANSATRIANVTGTFTDAATVSSGQTAATAAEIRSGYSAWVDGTEVKGSITNQAATTYNTSSSDQTIASGKYLSGTQTIKAVTTSGISAGNIKTGVTVKVGDANSATRIANVAGTFTAANTVSSGQTAATAAQIRSGYSAWVGGSEVKGTFSPSATLTSTTLWTNSSPTSNFASGSTVNLSQSMDNFDYIQINFRFTTSEDTNRAAIFKPSDIENYDTRRLEFGVSSSGASNNRFRGFGRTSTTQLKFTIGYVAASTSTNASWIIPTSVVGLKLGLS